MKYSLSSKDLPGSIILEYEDSSGMLRSANIDFTLTPPTAEWFSRFFPTTIEKLMEIKNKAANSKVEQMIDEVTFELFWKKYDNKVGKLEAQKAWDKLTAIQKQKAVSYIQRYSQELPSWQQKLMPASYINKKRYLDYE